MGTEKQDGDYLIDKMLSNSDTENSSSSPISANNAPIEEIDDTPKTDEYFQISPTIYDTFPKFHPPVNLYWLDEETASLKPFGSKGEKLTYDLAHKAQTLCSEDRLFVSKNEFSVYLEYIIAKVDLVLTDESFTPEESVSIIAQALTTHYKELASYPIESVYDKIKKDIHIFLHYILKDRERMKVFIGNLYTLDHSSQNHAYNSLVLGVWLAMESLKNYDAQTLKNFALGLFMHDIGTSKIPTFILSKKEISEEDMNTNKHHVLRGISIVQRFYPTVPREIKLCILEHHERLDGSGYPDGLEQVSIFGRITGLVDTVSAMMQNRLYAKKSSLKYIIATLSSSHDKYDINLIKIFANGIVNGTFDGLLSKEK